METPDREAPDREAPESEAPDREAPESGSRELYDRLREKGQDFAARGELDLALQAFDGALAWAEEHGDELDRDRAYCNRCSALIHQGQRGDVIRDLQRLLMRTTDQTNRWLAAAIISDGYYYIRNDLDRSRAYARQALGYANQLGSESLVGWTHNQLGNLFFQDGEFEKALDHYRKALAMYAGDRPPYRATLLANIGYCHMIRGRLEEGFRYLIPARRLALHLGIRWHHFLGRLYLGLSYGYLELDRLRHAERYARSCLALGEAENDADLVKKALYLLGETVKQAGDEFLAFELFSRLQREHYPEHLFLTDTLMNYNTMQLVNLWA